MSFSMLYFSRAAEEMSTASCCMSSLMSTFLMIAFGLPPEVSFELEPVSVEEEVVGATSAMVYLIERGVMWGGGR
jgi:hypothetical protein